MVPVDSSPAPLLGRNGFAIRWKWKSRHGCNGEEKVWSAERESRSSSAAEAKLCSIDAGFDENRTNFLIYFSWNDN
jgi:hypothetical protein